MLRTRINSISLRYACFLLKNFQTSACSKCKLADYDLATILHWTNVSTLQYAKALRKLIIWEKVYLIIMIYNSTV